MRQSRVFLAYKNNSDGSSQCGQCIFMCQPHNNERDTKRSLIDYKSHKIKQTVLSTTVAELLCFHEAVDGHDSSQGRS